MMHDLRSSRGILELIADNNELECFVGNAHGPDRCAQMGVSCCKNTRGGQKAEREGEG